MAELSIGLFGFGCVGQGLYHTLNHSPGWSAPIQKIVVRNRDKVRNAPPHLFHFDKSAVLDDPSLNTVVELIDDAEEAFRIAVAAMQAGKNLISANKKMLATRLPELLHIQAETGVSLLYEAAACGGIPIVRNLEEYFDVEPILDVKGIFNGTTNYILTRIFEDRLPYSEALSLAQQAGFAESDPSNDVEGWDPAFKVVLLGLHAFGAVVSPNEIMRFGISTLGPEDLAYAQLRNTVVRLVCGLVRQIDGTVFPYVLPSFLPAHHVLAQVREENNAVLVNGEFSGEQLFRGKGAGSFPTGRAVLSDLAALSRGYRYRHRRLKSRPGVVSKEGPLLRIYLRMPVEARPALDGKVVWISDPIEERGPGFLRWEGVIRAGDLKEILPRIRQSGGFVGLLETAS